jgi:hypothetical protein
MFLSADDANHVPEECFRPVMHEHVFKAAEILLAACANEVAQPHVIAKIAEGSW